MLSLTSAPCPSRNFAGSSEIHALDHARRIRRYDRHVAGYDRRVHDNVSKQRHVSWRTTPGHVSRFVGTLVNQRASRFGMPWLAREATYGIKINRSACRRDGRKKRASSRTPFGYHRRTMVLPASLRRDQLLRGNTLRNHIL